MSQFVRYFVRRVIQALPVLTLVVLGNFVLLKTIPGDLADVVAGENGAASEAYMAMLRAQYGLDQSNLLQLAAYLGQILRFDLGYSFRHSMPVSELILARVPATLLLIGTSILIAVLGGLIFGALSARYRGRLIDHAIAVVSSVLFATPVFWTGLMAIVLFAVQLRWLPMGGMSTVGAQGGAWSSFTDVLSHLLLPAVTLSLSYLAVYSRVTRAAMNEVYELDFVRTARAKGISERRVAIRHVLRNALLPIVTLSGLQLGSVLGGAIVVETVFSWPGMGRLAFEAISDRDINLLLSLFLCNSLLVIVASLIVDLTYALLDPRIEVTA
ncbi:MAG: ABC transporter permease [Microvirga sp.]